jgi:hypothetical protein
MNEVFIPKQGDIVKLAPGCGVVLDVYKNEKGEAILKVLYAKNIVKLQDTELLPLDLAYSLNMRQSDEADLFADLDAHRRWYKQQFDQRLSILKSAIKKL